MDWPAPLIATGAALQFMIDRLRDKRMGDRPAHDRQPAQQQAQRQHVPNDQLRPQRAERTPVACRESVGKIPKRRIQEAPSWAGARSV